MSYTPGPWGCVILSNGSFHVGPQADKEHRVATVHKSGYDARDTPHNARLIAAAPDMLRALKLVIERYQHNPKPLMPEEIFAARAAIAKAEYQHDEMTAQNVWKVEE